MSIVFMVVGILAILWFALLIVGVAYFMITSHIEKERFWAHFRTLKEEEKHQLFFGEMVPDMLYMLHPERKRNR